MEHISGSKFHRLRILFWTRRRPSRFHASLRLKLTEDNKLPFVKHISHHDHTYMGTERKIIPCSSTPSKDLSIHARLGSHSGNLSISKLHRTKLYIRHFPLADKNINNVILRDQEADFTTVTSTPSPTSLNQGQSSNVKRRAPLPTLIHGIYTIQTARNVELLEQSGSFMTQLLGLKTYWNPGEMSSILSLIQQSILCDLRHHVHYLSASWRISSLNRRRDRTMWLDSYRFTKQTSREPSSITELFHCPP